MFERCEKTKRKRQTKIKLILRARYIWNVVAWRCVQDGTSFPDRSEVARGKMQETKRALVPLDECLFKEARVLLRQLQRHRARDEHPPRRLSKFAPEALRHSGGVHSFGSLVHSSVHSFGSLVHSFGPFIWSARLVRSFGPLVWSARLVRLVHSCVCLSADSIPRSTRERRGVT